MNSTPPPAPQRESVSEDTKTCPQCAETVKAAAEKCRYCDYFFVSRRARTPVGIRMMIFALSIVLLLAGLGVLK